MGRVFRFCTVMALTVLSSQFASSQVKETEIHHILYLNSYALGYPWADSLVAGIQGVFTNRQDVQLYIEFLDGKRFGQKDFPKQFDLFRDRYSQIRFDAVITSDNDAIDFMMQYGNELTPDVPVFFCGINNPQDYPIEKSRYYGILDVVDLKTEINLIIKVLPSVKKLYFITDNSTTSLLNLDYAKILEKEYDDRLQFVYIHNYPVDSLIRTVKKFERGSAIALLNYYHDDKGHPVNSELLYKQIADQSPVPIFIDSETMLGKGIAGGIINNGAIQGRETALLALSYIEDHSFRPAMQVTLPKGKFYFDYAVLQKFRISENLLPADSVVINRPHKAIIKYLKFIFLLTGVIGFLLLIVVFLTMNVRRRKKAEELVRQKYQEIREKNLELESAQRQLHEMNAELEELNENLTRTNEALIVAKERSEESDKLKSAFLANISHEIRTPLNAIIGFSALLNDAEISEDEREEYFRIIGSNSDLLLRIIDDILDLSRIEAGQLKVYIESFQLGDFLREVIDSFIQEVNNKNIELKITTDPSADDLVMKTDRSRFKQIFCNLVSNAVKFTRQGTIEIGYRLDVPKEITFFVKDTGLGIEAKDLKNIFNRFWKAELKGERLSSGAGVGLAITRKLCEALGGRIRVESELGKGTIFLMSFQDYVIKKKEPDIILAKPDISVQKPEINFTVAVVEDESSNMYLLTRLLRNMNLHVISFTSGKEIVEYVAGRSGDIHLILMDIKMPDMDGLVATKKIREINPGIPIIAQTAYAQAFDIQKIRTTAFNDYILKPIKPAILTEKISKYLYPANVNSRKS